MLTVVGFVTRFFVCVWYWARGNSLDTSKNTSLRVELVLALDEHSLGFVAFFVRAVFRRCSILTANSVLNNFLLELRTPVHLGRTEYTHYIHTEDACGKWKDWF